MYSLVKYVSSGESEDPGLGDNFFGNREDAYSETVRGKRWDWYADDFSARLKPAAKRVLMNTCWHEEDVAGRVPGEYLWMIRLATASGAWPVSHA